MFVRETKEIVGISHEIQCDALLIVRVARIDWYSTQVFHWDMFYRDFLRAWSLSDRGNLTKIRNWLIMPGDIGYRRDIDTLLSALSQTSGFWWVSPFDCNRLETVRSRMQRTWWQRLNDADGVNGKWLWWECLESLISMMSHYTEMLVVDTRSRVDDDKVIPMDRQASYFMNSHSTISIF